MRAVAIALALVAAACTAPGAREPAGAAPRSVLLRALGNYKVRAVAAIGGDVIVAGPDGAARVDTETGDLRWRSGVSVLSRGALELDSDAAVFADAGEVVVVDAESGAERWRVAAERSDRVAPVFAGRSVMVMGPSGDLAAFDRASGEIRWRRDLAGPSFVRTSGRMVTVSGSVCLTLTLRDSARLQCVAAIDGASRWTHELPLPVSAPATADNELVIGAGRAGIFGFDALSGAVRWRHDMPGSFTETVGPIEFGDGWAVCDRVGNVRYIVDGAARWTRSFAAVFVNSQPTVAGDLVWVSDGARLQGVDTQGDIAADFEVEGVATHDFWSMAGGRRRIFVASEVSGLTVAEIECGAASASC